MKARGPNLDGLFDRQWRFDANWFEGFDRALSAEENRVVRVETKTDGWFYDFFFSVVLHSQRRTAFRKTKEVEVWLGKAGGRWLARDDRDRQKLAHGGTGASNPFCATHEECLADRDMAVYCMREQRLEHPDITPVVNAQRAAARLLHERYLNLDDK